MLDNVFTVEPEGLALHCSFTDLPLEHVVGFVIYLGLPYRLCEEVLKKP